jgi:hypothetical protein
MVSGMKVGWAVVGAVTLLTASVMVASRPSAFTPRLRIPASIEVPGRDSGPAVVRSAGKGESPTLVQLRADGAAPAPAVPRPMAINGPESPSEVYEPLPGRDELEPRQALLRFLFQSAPYSGSRSHESEAELSPPSLTLPTGMPLPRG